MKKYTILMGLLILFSSSVYALNFIEGWESGDFANNNWTFENEQGNWEVWEYFGNPGYSARFAGFPTIQNYDHRLVSPVLDGNGIEDIYIDYDVFGRVMMPGTEFLSIDVRVFGSDWETVAVYNTNTPGDENTWISESINISEFVADTNFQICLHAYGADSMGLIRWHIDNINVYEPMPAELPFMETWTNGNFEDNNWYFEPEQGSWNIMPYNNDNVAEFVFDDYLDYSFALTSQIFNGNEATEITLEYDVALYNYEPTGVEYLSVEVTNGEDWQELTSYNNSGDDFCLSESLDISEYAAGNSFQVRFRAHGDDAFLIDSWTVDNICITDGSPMQPPHLFGHVLDAETQEPITEAVVYVNNLIQISYDESGVNGDEFGYDFLELPAGNLDLQCTAPGYCIFNESISMQAGEAMQLDILLQPNPQNQVPQNLQANTSGMDEIELNWQAIEMDEYLEEIYDDGNAEFFADFQAQTNQIMANRFQFDEDIELQKASFYIELGLTVPWGEDPQVRFHILGESAGMPDINDQLCEPITLDNLINNNSVPAFWMEIPLSMTIPAETAFYLCIEWEQQNPASEYISLGADVNNPQGNSWIYMDGVAGWMQLLGEMGMNAMIRCQYLPQSQSDQILNGYNVYRNGTQVNIELINETTYLDSGLAADEYTYHVTAVYHDIESDYSEPVTIECGALPAPHYVNASLNLWDEPSVDLFWQINTFPGLEIIGYQLFRDGVQLNSELLPVLPRIYNDYDVENGEHHSYYLVAVYDQGESENSVVADVDVLLPPGSSYAVPWEEYVEIAWVEPAQPVAPVEILGYNIYNLGTIVNNEVVTDLSFFDYDFMDNNEYWVTTVYTSGESGMINSMSVQGGIEVILPPDSLAAEIEDQSVSLSWNRPDDNVTWHHWDSNGTGESFGMEDNSEFTGVVEFNEWDLLEYSNHIATQIAFYPTADANYTITIWTNDFMNPGQYVIIDEVEVENYQLNDWNMIAIDNMMIYQASTRIKIGVTCNNYTEPPLACDCGPNVSERADYVLIDDEWTNLSTDYGVDANWKIRLHLEEQQGGGPCRNRSNSILLNSYRIYRDEELIDEISSVCGYYVEQELSAGEYSYHVTGVYLVGGFAEIETDPCTNISVVIEEPFYPAPQQVNAEIYDYNKVNLSWEMAEPRPAYTVGDTTHNLRNIDVLNENREVELTGFYIYCDSTILDTLSCEETCWADSMLTAGVYCYQVAAVYEENISELTSAGELEIELPAPVEVYGEISGENVIVTWEMTHPEWELESFVIYRNSQFLAAEIPVCEYTDEDVPDGDYYYQVKAVFIGNHQSELSEPFQLTVTPVDNSLIPAVTELTGNYPNPFNPITTISFALSEPENVYLNIYNIKGELVKTLINKEMPAGYHQINWEGNNNLGKQAGSGIYLCSIKAGKYHGIKKMSLLK